MSVALNLLPICQHCNEFESKTIASKNGTYVVTCEDYAKCKNMLAFVRDEIRREIEETVKNKGGMGN